MTDALKGQCLCGAVKFQAAGPFDGAIGCHCAQCRRTSGHYTAGALARRENVAITEDDDALKWYRSSPEARRGFCVKCGSSMLWDYTAGDSMGIFVGSLDGPTGLSMTRHVFLDDKGDYYTITDGTPEYGAYDRVPMAPPDK